MQLPKVFMMVASLIIFSVMLLRSYKAVILTLNPPTESRLLEYFPTFNERLDRTQNLEELAHSQCQKSTHTEVPI
jgi:hypothetical protein